MPHKPEANAAAMLRYGLLSADPSLYSTRWLLGEPGMTRREHVLLSMPQLLFVGAHKPGTSRVYELIVGATKAIKSDNSRCCPPINHLMVSLMLFCFWES